MSPPLDFSLRLPLSAVLEERGEPASSQLEDTVVGLFDELRDRLLRYLLCLGVSMHDGEEIVQESFLLLFQHLRDGKSQENLRGWVFRVARNLALKLHRDNQMSQRHALSFQENLDALQARSASSPERDACDRQRREHLWAVVKALPEQDRSCLFLRAEGLPYREIADNMGMSLGSVAGSLARSFARLARADGGSL